MVCVPCIVIPFLLWVFHKFIQPWVLKFWNPWAKVEAVDFRESGPPKDVAADDKEFLYIQQKLKEHPVMVFSKKTCSFCRMAKQRLDETGLKYEVEEIGEKDNCNQMQDIFSKMTGERTVPRVFIGGKCVGGGSDVYTLHNQGKLAEMMKAAGATAKKED